MLKEAEFENLTDEESARWHKSFLDFVLLIERTDIGVKPAAFRPSILCQETKYGLLKK